MLGMLQVGRLTSSEIDVLHDIYVAPFADGQAGVGAPAPPLDLMRQPEALRLLVAALFDPQRRLKFEPPTALERCCEVIAHVTVSASASQAALPPSTDASPATGAADEAAECKELSDALQETAIICADDNTLSFKGQQKGIEQQLQRQMALPVCSIGVLSWLGAQFDDPRFYNSPNYSSFAPIALRLLQYVIHSERHLLQRPTVFKLLCRMLEMKVRSRGGRIHRACVRVRRRLRCGTSHCRVRGSVVS